MSVLIEDVCWVIPNIVVEARWPDGVRGFLNGGVAAWRYTDGLLCVVRPKDFTAAPELIRELGLGKNIALGDCAVVDMLRGPKQPRDWLDFRHITRNGRTIATAHLRGAQPCDLAHPPGWTWDRGMGAAFGFGRI